MRRTDEIRRSIDALESELAAEKAALHEAMIRERLDLHAARVYERFQSGEYIVLGAIGTLWWCRDGKLLTRVVREESAGLERLCADGVIEKETTGPADRPTTPEAME